MKQEGCETPLKEKEQKDIQNRTRKETQKKPRDITKEKKIQNEIRQRTLNNEKKEKVKPKP